MIIKIDMENAFDKVCHSFLFLTLRNFGFAEEFVNRIKACIGNP